MWDYDVRVPYFEIFRYLDCRAVIVDNQWIKYAGDLDVAYMKNSKFKVCLVVNPLL